MCRIRGACDSFWFAVPYTCMDISVRHIFKGGFILVERGRFGGVSSPEILICEGHACRGAHYILPFYISQYIWNIKSASHKKQIKNNKFIFIILFFTSRNLMFSSEKYSPSSINYTFLDKTNDNYWKKHASCNFLYLLFRISIEIFFVYYVWWR